MRIAKSMLSFDERGLVFGGKVVLAPADADGRIDIDAHEERILTLLSIAYRGSIPESIFITTKKAKEDLRDNREALASIRLTHLGLPEIENESPSWDRVQKATQEFDQDLLKTFNPAEPRDWRGRWTADGSDLRAFGPHSKNDPFYRDPSKYPRAPGIRTLQDGKTVEQGMDHSFIGDGQCATLTKKLVPTIPQHTPFWQRGDLVRGNTVIPVGTAIATFNYFGQRGTNGYGPPGKPEGLSGHSHTGIYLGQNATGIFILHQFSTSNGVKVDHLNWISWNNRPNEAGSRYYTIRPSGEK